MKKINAFGRIALGIVTAYVLFHILILLQFIPSHVVWGGKIVEPKTILILEWVALLVMLFLGSLILMKAKVIPNKWQEKTLNRWLLVFSVYFVLNTLGNLLAESIFEKAQALLTLILALSLFKMSKRNP
ncbi:hypothetical protein PP182_07190 [Maribacter sp. PR1]|uniref:DUF1648 domain-containing protein n=1 Tax=Maribacter cobaltidurans TaxID=1178778 RepID=A0ABU7IS98_9FLAO|nr:MULTISPECIES: hypothetical protein [Maribacter]MDC6388460.1 hypothetical protein [Maribacter sp. PR1]MEE1975849.1 hypothetical protein [Maribacter cobaltidurans]